MRSRLLGVKQGQGILHPPLHSLSPAFSCIHVSANGVSVWYICRRRCYIKPACVFTLQAITSLAALAKWLPCDSSTPVLDRVAVFRVHEECPNPNNEDYYLARPIQQATQLKKTGLHGGNKYMRGWWVTTIKWYELEAVLPNGERRYKLKKRPSKGEVFIVRGIVDVRFVRFARFERERGGRYILSPEMHQKILDQGDLTPTA